MPEETKPWKIIQQARSDVAIFEDPLPWLLTKCALNEVERVARIEDPTSFAAEVYNVVRRLEAAAAKYSQEGEPRIRQAVERVKLLLGPIMVMRGRVDGMTFNNPLEEAGREYVLDYLGWALWILNQRLSEWGY